MANRGSEAVHQKAHGAKDNSGRKRDTNPQFLVESERERERRV